MQLLTSHVMMRLLVCSWSFWVVNYSGTEQFWRIWYKSTYGVFVIKNTLIRWHCDVISNCFVSIYLRYVMKKIRLSKQSEKFKNKAFQEVGLNICVVGCLGIFFVISESPHLFNYLYEWENTIPHLIRFYMFTRVAIVIIIMHYQ